MRNYAKLKASYPDAIEYIALNDNPTGPDATDWKELVGYISVQLVAAIFNISAVTVAKGVAEFRKINGR